ncbi:MAG: LysM peptidoglycan-binding domain-containing protein [Candidatus Omnitrophota bacterium]
MGKLWVFISIIFLGGCLTTRSYTVEQPRVDREADGNQGFLAGTPKTEAKKSRLGDTRKFSVIEVEFGAYKDEVEQKEADFTINKKPAFKKEIFNEEVIIDNDDESEITVVKAKKILSQEGPITYIVQKNDTLQKVSQKFYKTTKKWQKIYEANKNTIKNPDKLYPGVEITIP